MNDGFNYINRVLNKDKDERIAKNELVNKK